MTCPDNNTDTADKWTSQTNSCVVSLINGHPIENYRTSTSKNVEKTRATAEVLSDLITLIVRREFLMSWRSAVMGQLELSFGRRWYLYLYPSGNERRLAMNTKRSCDVAWIPATLFLLFFAQFRSETNHSTYFSEPCPSLSCSLLTHPPL